MVWDLSLFQNFSVVLFVILTTAAQMDVLNSHDLSVKKKKRHSVKQNIPAIVAVADWTAFNYSLTVDLCCVQVLL